MRSHNMPKWRVKYNTRHFFLAVISAARKRGTIVAPECTHAPSMQEGSSLFTRICRTKVALLPSRWLSLYFFLAPALN